MYKIIDLDIDESLSADTKVDAVALVEMPAIEKDFVYFKDETFQEQTFRVTQEISNIACKARKYKEENPNRTCGTNVGWVRSSQLCDQKPITLDTVKRMYSYLSRHKIDLISSTSYDDGCGLLMYDAWGGKPALAWSKKILLQNKQFNINTENLPEYVSYPSGDTENDMLIEPIAFIEKVPYERKDAYISRCIAYHIKEKGWDNKQAAAVCYQQADEAFQIGEIDFSKVSFDYHETINTPRGQKLALQEIEDGNDVYIISAAQDKNDLLALAEKLGIPESRVYATGSNEEKINKIKELGISRHYDNNNDVIDELGSIGINFSIAPEYDEYSEEEIELSKLLQFLKHTDYQEFERIVDGLNGSTANEIKRRNHKQPTPYYLYKRIADDKGLGDRDFCMSLEDRYFTRFEIDALYETNQEFGHKRQAYSKWLYKGGPNCVHGWVRVIALGRKLTEVGAAPGLPGTAPKNMPNNGYYSAETKRKSEIAYIISQQHSSHIKPSGTEEYKRAEFKSDNEQRMLYSPLMIPNILIPRVENGEKYFVRFTKQAIEKIQRKFMIEQRLRNTNLEHDENQPFNDMVMVESWLVNGKSDKAFTLGYTTNEIPEGTWMVGYKILETPEGNNIWNNYIKTGKVKGLSAEGAFLLNFSQIKSDEYLLEEIINILNQIN